MVEDTCEITQVIPECRYVVDCQVIHLSTGSFELRYRISQLTFDDGIPQLDHKFEGVFGLASRQMCEFLKKEAYHPSCSKFIFGQLADAVDYWINLCKGRKAFFNGKEITLEPGKIIQVFVADLSLDNLESPLDVAMNWAMAATLQPKLPYFFHSNPDPLKAMFNFYKDTDFEVTEEMEKDLVSPSAPAPREQQ